MWQADGLASLWFIRFYLDLRKEATGRKKEKIDLILKNWIQCCTANDSETRAKLLTN
jgi:hypothetical protein